MTISRRKARKMTAEFNLEEELRKEPAEIQTPRHLDTLSNRRYIEQLNLALYLTEILFRFEREEENEEKAEVS
jgi:hypothetical protein